MSVTMDITFSDESFQLLKKLAPRLGHINLGNTLDLAVQVLGLALEAMDAGKEVGSLETTPDSRLKFKPFLFPKVQKVESSDVFCGQVISCEKCKKDFTLAIGMIYRENPGHESSRHIDCPHCTYCVEF